MGYVEQNLIAGETVVYRAKLHWIIFLWPAIIAAVGLYAFTVKNSAGAGFFLFIVGLVMFVSPYIALKTSEFAVTNRRVLIKTGFVRRRSLELLLQKIEGIIVDQGILGRILGYGTIVISGTGGTKEPFRAIADPLEFRRMVQQQTPGIAA